MTRRFRACLKSLPLAATLLLASAAPAEIIPVYQNRFLDGFVTVTNAQDFEVVQDTKKTSDFGVFDEVLELENRIGGAVGQVWATQTSRFSLRDLHATGAFSCVAEIQYEDEFVDAFGMSLFEFHFDVTTPEKYTLSGALEGLADGDTYLSLLGPEGIIFYLRAYEGAPLEIFETGTFEPGFYRLAVWTRGFGQAAPEYQTMASGSYEVDLSFGRRWDRAVGAH